MSSPLEMQQSDQSKQIAHMQTIGRWIEAGINRLRLLQQCLHFASASEKYRTIAIHVQFTSNSQAQ